jgi:hypothetical protein
MAYRSRGGRMTLESWSRVPREIKPSMRTAGHGTVRSMPRMAARWPWSPGLYGPRRLKDQAWTSALIAMSPGRSGPKGYGAG